MRGSPLRRTLGGSQSGTTRRPEHRAIRPEGDTVVRPESDTLSHTAPVEEEQAEAEREEHSSSYEGASEELERQEQAGVALARAKLDRAVGRWSNVAGMPPIASVKRPYRPIDFGGKQGMPGRREVSSLSDEPGRSASLLKPRLAASKSAAVLPAEAGRWRPAPVEAVAVEAEEMVDAAATDAAGGRQYRPTYGARVQVGTGARWWPGQEPSNRSDAAAVTYRLDRALEGRD